MQFRYNNDKNAQLGLERKISFDEIINASLAGNILDIGAHPNQIRYAKQFIMHVRIGDEVYSTPFVIEEDGAFFLKTIYANRKARKKFLEPKEKKKNANNDTKRSPA